jgi:hypothetical protein
VDRRRLEARVFDIVERVVAGGRAEDDLVECKSAWIEPSKAARRIAGQANAARGDDIVWIVGLDEDGHRVVPTDDTDLATWWPQVQRPFADAVTPDLTHVNVPTPHGTVVALGFRTDRSPYMITVADGPADRDIPWRSGTTTRTAHRGEVLSLLVEAAATPDVALIRPTVRATHYTAADDRTGLGPQPERIELVLDAKLFFEPAARTRAPAMLPRHQWAAQFDLGPDGTHDAVLEVWPNTVGGSGPLGQASETAHADGTWVRSSGVYVNGPDTLTAQATAELPPDLRQAISSRPYITVSLRMPVSGSTRTAAARQRLRWATGEKPNDYPPGSILGTWIPEDD